MILLMSCWRDSERGKILAIPSTLKSQESEVVRQLEEREPLIEFWRKKNLIWWCGGCLFCVTGVVRRSVKQRMSPSTNEEYICLTYSKSSSWSVRRGQFKSGAEIFKNHWISTFTFGSSWKLSELLKTLTVLCKMAVENSPQKGWRPFQKNEVIKFGWSE